MCAGYECSSWDDWIDVAYLETSPDYDPPDSTFVMTTWHEEETLGDVAEFFATSARFEGFEPTRLLVVCLGGDDASFEHVRDVARAQREAAWSEESR